MWVIRPGPSSSARTREVPGGIIHQSWLRPLRSHDETRPVRPRPNCASESILGYISPPWMAVGSGRPAVVQQRVTKPPLERPDAGGGVQPEPAARDQPAGGPA